MIRTQEWTLRAIILDKHSYATEQNILHHSLYNSLAKDVISNISFAKNDYEINIHVDRSKPRFEIDIFDELIKNHIQNYIPSQTRMDIHHDHSYGNYGLQAVDLFCHGISRKYELNDYEWYNVFAHKIKSESIRRK